MMSVGLPKPIEDFETKILFIRTVRQKNIVLFIDAEESQSGVVPFLVMEYMVRGSLRMFFTIYRFISTIISMSVNYHLPWIQQEVFILFIRSNRLECIEI